MRALERAGRVVMALLLLGFLAAPSIYAIYLLGYIGDQVLVR